MAFSEITSKVYILVARRLDDSSFALRDKRTRKVYVCVAQGLDGGSSVGIIVLRTGKVLACSFEINGSIRDVDLRQG